MNDKSRVELTMRDAGMLYAAATAPPPTADRPLSPGPTGDKTRLSQRHRDRERARAETARQHGMGVADPRAMPATRRPFGP